jgi:tRNA (guanine37-N1)-methyltransferase
MHFHIITIFPEIIEPYLQTGVVGRGIKKKAINVSVYFLRDFAKGKHKKVDNIPYGGGPGMVMMVEPISRAMKKIQQKIARRKTKGKVKVILTSPGGKEFTNAYADNVIDKKYTDVIILCGRYEGIDSRVKKIFRAEEVSIGNYVLTGGELAALVMLDGIARRIPNVLGNKESIEENRVSSHEMYTRPEVFEYDEKKYKVPKVLLSGHHKNIEKWRKGK